MENTEQPAVKSVVYAHYKLSREYGMESFDYSESLELTGFTPKEILAMETYLQAKVRLRVILDSISAGIITSEGALIEIKGLLSLVEMKQTYFNEFISEKNEPEVKALKVIVENYAAMISDYIRNSDAQ